MSVGNRKLVRPLSYFVSFIVFMFTPPFTLLLACFDSFFFPSGITRSLLLMGWKGPKNIRVVCFAFFFLLLETCIHMCLFAMYPSILLHSTKSYHNHFHTYIHTYTNTHTHTHTHKTAQPFAEISSPFFPLLSGFASSAVTSCKNRPTCRAGGASGSDSTAASSPTSSASASAARTPRWSARLSSCAASWQGSSSNSSSSDNNNNNNSSSKNNTRL